MKIYLASDHGGWFLKEELQKYLEGKKFNVEDLGNLDFVKDDDYPDFIIPLAKKVVEEADAIGIVLGRSGNGEAIAANKVKGIRAAVCVNEKMAAKARTDNDANVLSLPADYVNVEAARAIVDTFLSTSFDPESRHARRVAIITNYESTKH